MINTGRSKSGVFNRGFCPKVIFSLLLLISVQIISTFPLFSRNLEIDPAEFSGRVRLHKYISVYHDKDGSATIDTIREKDTAGVFNHPEYNKPNQGVCDYPVWVKFGLKNSGNDYQDLLITFDDPGIDEIYFYEPADDGSYTETVIIEGKRSEKAFQPYRKPILHTTLQPDTVKVYYIKLYSPRQGLLLIFSVSELKSFMGFEEIITMASGLLFGAVIFFIIYFLKLAYRMREETEAWFSLNLFAICLYYAIRFGFAQDLMPNSGPEFFNFFRYITFGLACFSVMKIFRLYMESRTMSLRLDRVLQTLQWAPLGLIPLVYLSKSIAVFTGALVYAAIPALTIYTVIKKWPRNSKEEKKFSIAWLGYISLYSLGLLISRGFIPWNDYMFGVLPVTIMWALITFPTSIVRKFNRYKSQSFVDGLTCLWNRRFFDMRLKREWSLCLRTKNPISLIIIDIDNFKSFNDNYGHLSGDECLKKIACQIKSIIRRDSDDVFRYGGEEFCVILPGTTEAGAERVAESILQEIRSFGPLRNDMYGPRVTVSMGSSTMIPDFNEKPENLINSADEAMYKAKNSGKNRLWISRGGTDSEPISTEYAAMRG